MAEVLYIVFGWLLGLLGPAIVDAIKVRRDRRALAVAIRAEVEDLQYRVAITSLLLSQRYGNVTREYLTWLKPKLVQYKGNEPVESIRMFAEEFLKATDEQLVAISARMRAQEGVGLSLKTFQAGLVESSLPVLLHFPADYQRCVHEFRNHLHILNQEVERALDSMRMTYDSSLTPDDHERLKADIKSKYVAIQGMCMRVADRLQSLINYDPKRI